MIEQALTEIREFSCQVALKMGKLTERVTITLSPSLKTFWDALPDEVKQDAVKDIRGYMVLVIDRHLLKHRIGQYTEG